MGHVVFETSNQNPHLMVNWLDSMVGSFWVILDMVEDGDEYYVQSMLPLQWRFVGRQVRSLQGVEPAGQVELVRHRLEIKY